MHEPKYGIFEYEKFSTEKKNAEFCSSSIDDKQIYYIRNHSLQIIESYEFLSLLTCIWWFELYSSFLFHIMFFCRSRIVYEILYY